MLLENKADVNAVSKKGTTSLSQAAQEGHKKYLRKRDTFHIFLLIRCCVKYKNKYKYLY